MRSGRMTVILLATAIAIALAVPTLRGSFSKRAVRHLSPTHGYPGPSRLAEIVAENPQDPEPQYAFALSLWSELESGGQPTGGRTPAPVNAGDVRKALREAVAAMPQDPAPYLSLAVFELAQASLRRLPQEELRAHETLEKPTAEQLERVRAARGSLERVSSLDPDNALAHYLIAWTWLADGEVDLALSALSRAANTDRWTSYERRRSEVVLRLLDHTVLTDQSIPMAAIAITATQTHRTGSWLRSLARALREIADDLRAEGQDGRAIHVYEALLRAGHLMRTDARNLLNGLLGAAVTAITVSADDWAPPEEDERLEANPELEETELRVEQFAAYLRAHNRGDLADFAEDEVTAAQRWNAQAEKLPEQMIRELMQDVAGGATLHASVIWMTAGAMLLVALLVGGLSLIAGYWREPRTRTGWSHAQWLLLLAVLLVPGQVVSYVANRHLLLHGAQAGNIIPGILGIGILASIVAWMVGVLTLSLRKRRLVPEEERLSRPRRFLRGLRALILPTLAAMVLLSMPATYAIERNLKRMGEKYREVALEGEIDYYGLDADSGDATDAEGG